MHFFSQQILICWELFNSQPWENHIYSPLSKVTWKNYQNSQNKNVLRVLHVFGKTVHFVKWHEMLILWEMILFVMSMTKVRLAEVLTLQWDEVTQDRVTGGHRNDWALTSWFQSLIKMVLQSSFLLFHPVTQWSIKAGGSIWSAIHATVWEQNLQFTCKTWHHVDTMPESQFRISIYCTINLF